MISSGLGTDIAWLGGDIDPKFSLASGIDNLLNALIRRLSTPRHGLFYDLAYGFDLTQYVNADVDASLLQEIRSGVVAQCSLDDRVTGCSATVSYDPSLSTIKVNVAVSSLVGTGRFVAEISKVSLSFLKTS